MRIYYIHIRIIAYIYITYVDSTIVRPIVMTDPIVNLSTTNHVLVMKCLHNEVNFNYHWKRKHDNLPLGARGINSPQLTIVNLRPTDSGDYRCKMSNRTGTIKSRFFTVHINGKKSQLIIYPANYFILIMAPKILLILLIILS